ncbi:MAG: hypothetical protein V3R28_03900 [Desulfatiglandales bacterium]
MPVEDKGQQAKGGAEKEDFDYSLSYVSIEREHYRFVKEKGNSDSSNLKPVI